MSQTEFSKHDRTLMILVTQYQTLAMASLGKIQNPATGKIERDLDQARFFIDILEMFKVKCRSNTPDEVLQILDAAVMDMQLNFLDERKKDEAKKDEAKKDEAKKDETAEGTAAEAESAEDASQEDESTDGESTP